MPTWQTTLVRPTRPTSAMTSSGPATQPTRQPIIRSSLDADPTVIVRSTRPGWAPGWMGGWPSKRIRYAPLYTTRIHTTQEPLAARRAHALTLRVTQRDDRALGDRPAGVESASADLPSAGRLRAGYDGAWPGVPCAPGPDVRLASRQISGP